jgi:hypothetical protein
MAAMLMIHLRILDILSLAKLEIMTTVNLEEPVEPSASNIASTSKNPIRLSPFWLWQDIHISNRNDVSYLSSEARLNRP